MNVRFILSLLAIMFVGFSLITTETGCARIAPPTGGPRDSMPPLIINITPKDSTLNFKGNKVQIYFNEFVQVDDIQKNLLVSPTPKVNPTVESKLRTITVTIRDTLEENTTYALDFGNAIKDLNEGNTLRDYRYIFSTGPTIDSLQLGGRVLIAETGKPDSTLVVMLHLNLDDSAVIKDRPRYVTRLDSSGYFEFDNLATGSYDIYALKDEGGQRRYLSKQQFFAFADSAVTSQSQKRDIILYAYTEKDTTEEIRSKTTTTPTAARRRDQDSRDDFLQVQTNLSGGSLDLLSNLEMSFEEPLRYFDSAKVRFTDDTLKPLTGYHFVTDTTGKKVTLVYPWTENTKYNVILDTSFAEDTSGRKLRVNDTIPIQTKRNVEYGLVRLRFLGLQMNQDPVLQFVQGDNVKYSHVFTNNEFYARLFAPGEYDLRIVFDENKNGLWDTGEFFKVHRQPEKVRLVSRKLIVKANWDNEIDIQL